MKKLSILLLTSFCISCGSAIRTISGTTTSAVKKQASIEYNCPMDSIKLLEKRQHAGNATYALDVCGTRRVYTQVGSVLQEKK
jgi:hypothetical protein